MAVRKMNEFFKKAFADYWQPRNFKDIIHEQNSNYFNNTPMHSFVILYAQNGERFSMQKLGKVNEDVSVSYPW